MNETEAKRKAYEIWLTWERRHSKIVAPGVAFYLHLQEHYPDLALLSYKESCEACSPGESPGNEAHHYSKLK